MGLLLCWELANPLERRKISDVHQHVSSRASSSIISFHTSFVFPVYFKLKRIDCPGSSASELKGSNQRFLFFFGQWIRGRMQVLRCRIRKIRSFLRDRTMNWGTHAGSGATFQSTHVRSSINWMISWAKMAKSALAPTHCMVTVNRSSQLLV